MGWFDNLLGLDEIVSFEQGLGSIGGFGIDPYMALRQQQKRMMMQEDYDSKRLRKFQEGTYREELYQEIEDWHGDVLEDEKEDDRISKYYIKYTEEDEEDGGPVFRGVDLGPESVFYEKDGCIFRKG